MSDNRALDHAAKHAKDFLDGLDERPVSVTTSIGELRSALGRSLEQKGVPDHVVIDELARDADPGLLGTAGGRFFGWVIGGGLPAAVAADWLASTWDQNGAIYACSPASAVVEEIAGEWLKDLLRLPRGASFGFVTGCQMAHLTALAAARQKLLADRDWDVRRKGLSGAPPLRFLTGPHRHESLIRAVVLLGMGADSVEHVPCNDQWSTSVPAIEQKLKEEPDRPTVVCLQAGDLNLGTYDSFEKICPLAHAHNAWVHVDGAFGLWAAASDRYRHLLNGVEQADSWATDGHKWLNIPLDSGMVFVAHPEAHRAALTMTASYFVAGPDTARDQMDWNPEWSRRSRGFAIYAALRSMGRDGLADLVDRCCRYTVQLVDEIDALDGAEALTRPIINQGLVRFLSADGNHDNRTDQVIERVRAKGVAWFGGTTWNGVRAMRISVCNWRTNDRDIERTIDAIREALEN